MKLTNFLKRIENDNSGATAIEYGLIVGLIALAIMGALQGVATSTTNLWNSVETETTKANVG